MTRAELEAEKQKFEADFSDVVLPAGMTWLRGWRGEIVHFVYAGADSCGPVGLGVWLVSQAQKPGEMFEQIHCAFGFDPEKTKLSIAIEDFQRELAAAASGARAMAK